MSDKSNFKDDTDNIIKKTLSTLAEGITGLAASERKELALSVGHIFQSMRKGQFLSKLADEWKFYKDKGKIKEDYQVSEQHCDCLQEMFDFLDNDMPDNIRFQILKKIFLVAASEELSDRNSLLPLQYMKLCRELSSGEIIVMSTTYHYAKTGFKDMDEAREWLVFISDNSGLKHPSLVASYEEKLIDKYLLTPRALSDKSGIAAKPYFRLTSLGYDICEYLAKYVDIEENATDKK